MSPSLTPDLDRSWDRSTHCALWWRNTPPLSNHRVGLVGQFYAEDEAAAAEALQFACRTLTEQGCTLAIGPMDGNPWQHYRWVTERGSEPPFFLEPENPEAYPRYFLDQGFSPIAHYRSALSADLNVTDPRLQPVRDRLQRMGVSIRSLNLANLDAELRQIYAIVTTSFRHNFLYVPIPEPAFITQYHALLPFLKPEFVWLAEHQQRTIGFLFTVPNWRELEQGQAIRTIILKTIAVLPERQYAGLGQVLFEHCHAIAAEAGYDRALYALVHDANPCANLVRRYAQPIRRYALFAKPLTTLTST